MNNLSLLEVTTNLDQLIDQITETHQPITVKGTKNEVVIISSEDWSAIQETIYLNSISGYVDSIQEVIESPREEWINAKDLGL